MKFIPHTPSNTKEMLDACDCKEIEDLFRSIPKNSRTKGLDLPKGLTELEVRECFKNISNENKNCEDSFLGAGAYKHYVPSAVSSLANRAEFVTPYTPYQPEVSQGTLQVLFEYQSFICRITGMDVSNASHYDGATAAAEAGLISRKIVRKKSKLIIPNTLSPFYIDVIKTVCGNIEIIDCPNGKFEKNLLEEKMTDDVSAVFLPFPNFWGIVEDYKELTEFIHSNGALAVAVIPEMLSLGMFEPPSVWNADIVVGEGLSFGLPVFYGGPTLGIYACKEKYLRTLPGRLCGETEDSNGRKSYVLTLATREQHIRRERATSNICTNQALCATTATIYLSLLGGDGLTDLARINFDKAEYAKQNLLKINGVELAFDVPTFNEFTLKLSKNASEIVEYCKKKNIFPGVNAGKFINSANDKLIVCCTEMNSKNSIDRLVNAVAEALK